MDRLGWAVIQIGVNAGSDNNDKTITGLLLMSWINRDTIVDMAIETELNSFSLNLL